MQFSTALRYTGFFIFCYLLLLSLSYGESAYQPIFTLLVVISIYFCLKIVNNLQKKYSASRIFLGVLLIGLVIRFLWAVLIPTLPVSDFIYFHENAINLSQGTAISTEYIKYIGYNLLLSLGYRIYPEILTGKLINAAASTLSILLIYLTGSKLVNQQVGLIAASLFAILPSEINMVSVLSTEVIATTAGLVTAFFLTRTISNNFNHSIIWSFFAGLFYGLGLTVRSSLIFYLPVMLLFIFFIAINIKQRVKISSSLLIGITTGLFFITISYSLIVGYISLEPLKAQDTIIGVLIGTNASTSGTWNLDDNNLFYSWPANERNNLVVREATRRITLKPAEFLLLIPKKFAVLMASNDYGNAWSLYAIDWGEGNLYGIHAPNGYNLERYKNFQSKLIGINGLLSQAVYIFIWLFAFYAFIILKKDSVYRSISLIVLTITIFTLLPHIILEVQGRYHHTIMPFITLLAACGVQQNINMDTNEQHVVLFRE